jgi:hypothetical protein
MGGGGPPPPPPAELRSALPLTNLRYQGERGFKLNVDTAQFSFGQS